MNSFHKIVAKAIEANRSPEETSLQETEEKFSSLVLAFKTDRETLDKRKELHLRARDIAEQNIQKELEGLKEGMKTLNQICNNSPSQQTLSKVQHHVEVLEQSVARMSSQAEVHGAVQQELRVSRAIDVMVRHVENLKKVYEKEHAELLEARKTLCAGRRDSRESVGDASRSTNLPGLPQFRASRRRASIAVISKNPLQLRSSLASSKLVEPNSSRLVHRNSALMSHNLSVDEADEEDVESTDNPRLLIRRKSSSTIELPSSFVDQLRLTSGLDPPTTTSTRLEEEEEEEEEEGEKEDEDDEDDDRDTTRVNESQEDDSETESLAMYFVKRKPVTRDSKCTHTPRLCSILANGISFGQRLLRKLSQMSSVKLNRARPCVQSMSRYASRAHFQGRNCRTVTLVILTLTAFSVLSMGLWLGWIPVITLYGIFSSK